MLALLFCSIGVPQTELSREVNVVVTQGRTRALQRANKNANKNREQISSNWMKDRIEAPGMRVGGIPPSDYQVDCLHLPK
jgi:hypothetical protein